MIEMRRSRIKAKLKDGDQQGGGIGTSGDRDQHTISRSDEHGSLDALDKRLGGVCQKHGGAGWTRTSDNAIMSRALYHLSYGTAQAGARAGRPRRRRSYLAVCARAFSLRFFTRRLASATRFLLFKSSPECGESEQMAHELGGFAVSSRGPCRAGSVVGSRLVAEVDSNRRPSGYELAGRCFVVRLPIAIVFKSDDGRPQSHTFPDAFRRPAVRNPCAG